MQVQAVSRGGHWASQYRYIHRAEVGSGFVSAGICIEQTYAVFL